MTWAALESRTNAAALVVFGETVRIDGVDLQGDYHEPDEEVRAGDGSAIARVPRIIVQSTNVPASPVGKPVIARSRNFTIADARHDGRGLAVLELEAA